ncbi:RNase H family protein [Anatilimnocola sp. NA78]|uniref:RNase H family protein n=1 Tax=Anatilimnocola sp. NA78 TaxID=3415683 RepID=UPI003CE450D1
MSVSAPHFLLFAQATGNLLVGAGASTPSEAEVGGRWRFVIQSDDGQTVLDAEDEEEGDSRERLELLAIVRGLEALDQPSQVTLVTHSRAVSRGLSEGLVQWRENDWQWERFGSLTPVKNSDLWRRVDQALNIHQVKCRLATSGGSDDLNLPQPASSPAQATRSSTRQLRDRTVRFDPGTPATTPDSTAVKPTPRRSRSRQPVANNSLLQRSWNSLQQLFGR